MKKNTFSIVMSSTLIFNNITNPTVLFALEFNDNKPNIIIESDSQNNEVDATNDSSVNNVLNDLIEKDISDNWLTKEVARQVGKNNIKNLTDSDFESITEIDLSSQNLSGDIPDELYLLTNLKRLKLSSNKLTGTLSSSIGNLINLEYFNISSNGLTGTIPNEIGLCTKLTWFDISRNKFSGEIPLSVGGLVRMASFNVGNNALTGNIPKEIGNWKSAESIYFHNNKFTGNIPKEIEGLVHLVNLYLYNNDLFGSLNINFSGFTKLRDLQLHKNAFTGTIPNSIYNLSNLRILNLTDTELTGEISEDIGNLTNLRELYLYRLNLTGEIPKSIGNLKRLEKLNLKSNKHSGGIPETIGQLTNLKELILSDTPIGGTLPNSISNLVKLKKIDLKNTQITGTIPSELSNLIELEYIDLSKNNLSGVIPIDIGNLSNLTDFVANENKISGTIPDSIGKLNNLVSLELSNNELECVFPQCLVDLPKLKTLNLAFNKISGFVPDNFLENLSSVKLQYNLLSGRLSGDAINKHGRSVFANNFFENLSSQKQIHFKSIDELLFNKGYRLTNSDINKLVHYEDTYGSYSDFTEYVQFQLFTLNPDCVNDDGEFIKSGISELGVRIKGNSHSNVYAQTPTLRPLKVYAPPEITISPSTTDLTNENISLSITAKTIDSISKIECNGEIISTSDTASIVVTSNGTFAITAYDSIGGVSTVSYDVNNIDKIPPSATVKPNVSDEMVDSVEIIIDAFDNVDVEKIILPDGTEVIGKSASYRVYSNGVFKFTIVDTVGNITTQSITISNINSLEVTISTTSVDFGVVSNSEYTERLNDLQINVLSPQPYTISVKSGGDIIDKNDSSNILESNILSVKSGDSPYYTIEDMYTNILSSSGNKNSVSHYLDFRLKNPIGIKSGIYSTNIKLKVTQN